MTKPIVERLRENAAEYLATAKMVSNIRKPLTDNDYGRMSTKCTEMADTIEALVEALDKARPYVPQKVLATIDAALAKAKGGGNG